MNKLYLYIKYSCTVIVFIVIIHLTVYYCFIQSSVCVILLQFKNLNFHGGCIYAFPLPLPPQRQSPFRYKAAEEKYWKFSPGSLLYIAKRSSYLSSKCYNGARFTYSTNSSPTALNVWDFMLGRIMKSLYSTTTTRHCN